MSTTYVCSSCNDTFSSKVSYVSHSKKCSSQATIYLPHTNQTIVVEKNLEGKFICHCTNKGCPKPFKFADNLRSHIVKAGSRWNGPGIKGDPTFEQLDLTYEEELAPGAEMVHGSNTTHDKGGSHEFHTGLAPGRWVHSYAMPGTGVGAGPSKPRTDLTHDKGSTPASSKGVHLFDTIPGAEVEPIPSRASMDLAQESDSDIDQLSEHSTGTSTSEEATPSGPMPPQDEIMCSPPATKPSTTPTVTPQAASPSAWSNMLTQDDVNMGSPTSDKSAPPQQLPPPLPSLLSVMHSHSASTTQGNQLPSTSTSTTPASHTIGLLHHTYLDSLNLAVNAEFHFLTCQICQAALAPEALSLLDKTGELVLQRLNSPDPMKSGISNTPFHKHLHKTTMKQYILPVVALLAMLIRQEYSGKPFSGSNPRLMELLAVLCIDDPQGRDALDLIHQLLFEVWTTAWTHDGDRDIVDPTERCLALMMLRQDGAFKEPQEVTPVIARFQYCMHLTFLQEIHHHLESDPDSDELEHCMDLENFFVEKRHYTFSHLCSLQH
ncbi:hypothetical protein EDC04DRAFT_3143786 [Pisolithus marmoratus]|nr:hypothetical protein EDC04DRAFT_3143786 [Pisolithus marmoratus]